MDMPIYDIDFTAVVKNTAPPNHRTNKLLSYVDDLLSPLQYDHDNFFDNYIDGSINSGYPEWSNIVTYHTGDRVIYGGAVWEQLPNMSLGVKPPGRLPSWYLISPDFIGVSERILYNAQKIVFEWALNRWFMTTFRQPPSLPDIYINEAIKSNAFIIGYTESESSAVYALPQFCTNFIYDDNTTYIGYDFIIFMPLATYNSLSTNAPVLVCGVTDPVRDAIVR